MTKLFITSSGTGIGKTLVTCALTWQLRQQGQTVKTLKPIISDFAEHRIEQTDTYDILHALEWDLTGEHITTVSPWRFIAPLSPDMAAAREGRSIDFDDLIAFCARDHTEDHLLIEGVGGTFVPLDDTHLVADWITALTMPALLVVGSYLGTLSHTIASYEAMTERGLAVAGIVISESEESPVPLEETRDTLARFIPDMPFAIVPRINHWKDAPDLTHLVT